MVKVQPHKKTVVQSDLRRQHHASTVAKQAMLPNRDPRTVCMTEGELSYLLASFRANRWPERAEKERLAQLIGKSYEKVHHWFSNQRQKLANVEKAMKKTRTPQTSPRSSSHVAVSHIGGPGTEPVHVKHEERESLLGAQAPDAFTREASSDMSDISVEDGARLLLDFIASVRAAQSTPSP
ncbi:hypothetical protein F5888DRAFT_1679099 [Russula emetica]|nr:hypothetical protein F5888DRAFT_1679099 [Russula emetica]